MPLRWLQALRMFILRACRSHLYKYGRLEARPGPHQCWKCVLYDDVNGACNVQVYVKEGAEGRLLRQSLVDWCVWHFSGVTKHVRVLDVDKRVAELKATLEKAHEQRSQELAKDSAKVPGQQ